MLSMGNSLCQLVVLIACLEPLDLIRDFFTEKSKNGRPQLSRRASRVRHCFALLFELRRRWSPLSADAICRVSREDSPENDRHAESRRWRDRGELMRTQPRGAREADSMPALHGCASRPDGGRTVCGSIQPARPRWRPLSVCFMLERACGGRDGAKRETHRECTVCAKAEARSALRAIDENQNEHRTTHFAAGLRFFRNVDAPAPSARDGRVLRSQLGCSPRADSATAARAERHDAATATLVEASSGNHQWQQSAQTQRWTATTSRGCIERCKHRCRCCSCPVPSISRSIDPSTASSAPGISALPS